MKTVRTIIPLHLQDLGKWKTLDENALNEHDRDWYLRTKKAIEMFVGGVSLAEIENENGVKEDALRRAIHRCLTDTERGDIFGFRALRYGKRLVDYTRRKSTSGEYRGRGGHAGSFEQLLEKYPLIRSYIENEYLKDPRSVASEQLAGGGSVSMKEARIRIRDLHDKVIQSLKNYGLQEEDYPFNTNDNGYRSLCKYCENIRMEGTIEVVKARAGKDAALRHSVGIGITRLMRAQRPYSCMQMDYHKIDAASLIGVTNKNGETMWFAVKRWHLGMLIDEYYGTICGAYVAFEANPSGDTALEILDSALRPDEYSTNDPKVRFTDDGKALAVQLIPELAFQSFSSLKVDNGWANTAKDVVNNIMNIFGCSIGFGPVRAWFRRDSIERTFGELTRNSLQRTPSTYGSGPLDTKKDDPEGNAYRYRIMVSDCVSLLFGTIRKQNLEGKKNLDGSSPIQALKHALENPKSGFFHQPLPIATQENMRLMYSMSEQTVKGSFSKNIRPYVKNGGWIYTNQELAISYHLIGKKLILYTNRRLCRIVHAVVKDTGEELGLLIPQGGRDTDNMTLSERTILSKAQYRKRNHSSRIDALSQYMREQVAILKDKKGGKGAKTTALKLAAHVENQSRAELQAERERPVTDEMMPVPSMTSKVIPEDIACVEMPRPTSDPLGLLTGPPMRPVKR